MNGAGKNNANKKNQSGFTLLELTIVISVIALMASIILTTSSKAKQQASDVVRFQNYKLLVNMLSMYYQEHGTYPTPTVADTPTCFGPTGQECLTGSGITGDSALTQSISSYGSKVPSADYKNSPYFLYYKSSDTLQFSFTVNGNSYIGDFLVTYFYNKPPAGLCISNTKNPCIIYLSQGF